MELRNWTREGQVEGAELAERLLTRKKERLAPMLKEALAVMLSLDIAAEEKAAGSTSDGQFALNITCRRPYTTRCEILTAGTLSCKKVPRRAMATIGHGAYSAPGLVVGVAACSTTTADSTSLPCASWL
jgi:hypothetical protein